MSAGRATRRSPSRYNRRTAWPSIFTGEAAARRAGAWRWRSSSSASAYNSHLLQFDRQEHKSPQMLAMNFRGRLPVLRDDDYVVFESLAILYYLDQKYPDPPIFGRNARGGRGDHARDLRVPVVRRAAAEADRRGAARSATSARSMTVTRGDAPRGGRGAHHRAAPGALGLGGRRELLGRRHDDLSGYSPAAARAAATARRTNWRRAFCPWRSTTRRSAAGSIAWPRCPGTSAPGRRTGAERRVAAPRWRMSRRVASPPTLATCVASLRRTRG